MPKWEDGRGLEREGFFFRIEGGKDEDSSGKINSSASPARKPCLPSACGRCACCFARRAETGGPSILMPDETTMTLSAPVGTSIMVCLMSLMVSESIWKEAFGRGEEIFGLDGVIGDHSLGLGKGDWRLDRVLE